MGQLGNIFQYPANIRQSCQVPNIVTSCKIHGQHIKKQRLSRVVHKRPSAQNRKTIDLCWSGMTETEHTSGSNDEEERLAIDFHLFQSNKSKMFI